MLKDSDSSFVLVHKKYSQKVTGLGAQVLCYEDLLQLEILDEKKPLGKATSDNLAYIIYTSGSTGKPKGVMITHRNVIGLLYGFGQVTQDGPRRVNVCVSPFNFDVSVGDIFSTLCFGGTLHLLLPENFTNGDWYAQYLVENGITTGYVLPNLLEEVAKAFKKRRSELNLKILITGLAPKKESILQSFREIFPRLRILNSYGPTEVTIRCTGHLFTEMKDALHDVPIGVPYPNYQVYIVDANLQPVPVGVAGELLIGGVGIARGYNQRPGLTAEKFIPDPFGSQPGGRLYRSGDIVRYLPDGIIEFLGRADDQVKVSGYRIELGEIESHLTAHPMVQKCLAMVREDQPGDKRLVAYVISTPGDDPTGPELRSYLAASLPVYMLPSQIILLDALPMLTNGKVNRMLLPTPDQSRPELDADFQEAGTPSEVGLTAIWQKLLRIERIGIHDNFFELGGHSLLAIRMIEMTKDQLGLNLPLSAIFEAPSIHQLGSKLDAESWQPRWSSLVAIRSSGERSPLFLVPPSATTGMKFARLTELLGNSQPVYSFNHPGLDGSQEPQSRMEDIAALYVSEMLAFQPQGPYLLGGMCFGVQVALEMAQQLKKQGIEPAMLIFLDPGDPQKGKKYIKPSRKGASYYVSRIVHHIGKGTFTRTLSRNIASRIFKINKSIRTNKFIRQTNQCHHEAIKNYQSMPYNGRVVFIQNGERKEKLVSKWKEILTGPVQYSVIPNSTHRTFLKKEKFIQIIAGLLNKTLDDFHATQPARPDGSLVPGSPEGEKRNG
jgi:amino acid adenylation domain-containing protein